MSSFGTTVSSGIQDISAILSLLGTEQCELHVGSALRGGGGGGYLYAAITPVSIFGSLGPAKAAFSIMLVGLPFIGARTLQHMGFETKGDAIAVTMLDGDRYEAETRLLKLLKKHYIRSAQNLSLERPAVPFHLIPLRPWNLWLLMASLLVACLGVTPYLHFSIRHHTSFPALTLFFPFSRVIGGLLCVFPGQLILQYRIEMILKQRILFKGFNDLLKEQNLKIPTHLIDPWDESVASEKCLSSLRAFLETNEAQNTGPFVECLAQILGLPPASTPQEVAKKMKSFTANTWSWLAMLSALLLGFLMSIVGYVGCFTIVQNSLTPSDTYIWLGLEATLAMIRLFIWASNPPWDDSDGILLKLTPNKNVPLPAAKPISVLVKENWVPSFKIVDHTQFWEGLTLFSGPVNIDGMKNIDGPQYWYSWIPQDTKDVEILCIILQHNRETILCMMNNNHDMMFYHADIISNPGYAMQMGKIQEDHVLMKDSSEFKINVFEYYNFIMSSKSSDCVPIQVSWPLLESSKSYRCNNFAWNWFTACGPRMAG
ncbi:hypothetical protein FB451DRAFT_490690 [Mycena latifolia]|nr:hypothetical protein FB451DRAFT_490690 [Mycena latifolia]